MISADVRILHPGRGRAIFHEGNAQYTAISGLAAELTLKHPLTISVVKTLSIKRADWCVSLLILKI